MKLLFLAMLLTSSLTSLYSQQDEFNELFGKLKLDYRGYELNVSNIKIEILEDSSSTTTNALGNFKFQRIKNDTVSIKLHLPVYPITYMGVVPKDLAGDTIFITINKTENWITEETIQIDLDNNMPRLFIGCTLFVYPNDPTFESKYGVLYVETGCVVTVKCSDMEKYNQLIFNYLDTKFGNTWREKVNPEVIGIK